MRDDEPFIRAICERPDDMLPRLIYADYLDERGDPRGEFVRVQVELARIIAAPAFRKLADTLAPTLGRVTEEVIAHGIEQRDDVVALRSRERALLTAGQARWVLDALGDQYREYVRDGLHPAGWPYWEFRRGFVEVVTMTWESARRHLRAVRKATPLQRVVLTTWPDVGVMYELSAKHGFGGSPGNRIERWRQIIAAEYPGIEWELPVQADDFRRIAGAAILGDIAAEYQSR